MGKLPSPIPGNVYRTVEHHVRHRKRILQAALQALSAAEDDAGAIRSPGAGNCGGSGGGVSDRVGDAAIRIAEARAKVTRAQLWISVYRWTMDAFAGTDAERAVRYLFDKGINQAETARKLNCDRQTVRRYKDDFLLRAAFMGVSMGLIRLNNGGRVQEDELVGTEAKILIEDELKDHF